MQNFNLIQKFYTKHNTIILFIKTMQRERPLQYSMFLPDSNSVVTKKPSIPIQHNFPIPQPRKVISGYTPNQPHPQYPTIIHQNRPIIQPNNIQQLQNISRMNQLSVHQLYQKLDKLNKIVDKHQIQLNSISSKEQIVKYVSAQMKKNFPILANTNDNQNYFVSEKIEIKQLQNQISKIPKITQIQQLIKKQLIQLKKTNQNTNPNKICEINPFLNDLLKKRDQFFQNIMTNIQTQLSILKKSLSTLHTQMKISPIQSPSCITLKYQQLLKARSKSQNDIILNQSTYYLDHQGHLLDSHSRYIVDQKGKKIKLQQKHLILLRHQNILQ